jgi:hypothetical protein
MPIAHGWEQVWVAAIDRWGHVNIATDAHLRHSAGGIGTIDDPMLCTTISAQCSGFHRRAIGFVGYYDPRYGKYGGEHVEHSRRLLRAGYGGRKVEFRGTTVDGFYGIRSELAIHPDKSFGTPEDRKYNTMIDDIVSDDPIYRAPFYNNAGLRRLRDEIAASELSGR